MELEPKPATRNPCGHGQLLCVGDQLQSQTGDTRLKSVVAPCIITVSQHSLSSHGVSSCVVFLNTIADISTSFSEPSVFVVVEGVAGSGKTTIVHNILSKLLPLFTQIVFIALDSNEGKLVKTFEDLADAVHVPVSQIQNDLENGGKKVLFIFDGFDQFVNTGPQWEATIVSRILSRDMFPHCAILLLSRPSGLQCLWDNTKISFHFVLEGLKKDEIFAAEHEEFSSLCDQYPYINDLCQIPLINQVVFEFFEHKTKLDGIVFTDVCMHIIISMIERELRRIGHPFSEQINLFSLPSEELCESFISLCQFAFQSLVNDKNLLTIEEEQMFLSSCSLSSAFFINGNGTFGLVERCGGISIFSKQHAFRFIHPLIQEFLAGFYLQYQPPLDQLDLIYRHGQQLLCRNHFYWLLSFFGTSWRKQVDFNPMKLMFSTLLEFLISVLEIQKYPRYSLTLLLCIAETKDNDIWKKLVSKLGGDLRLQISSEDISQHKWLIATMISYSSVFEWNIHASDLSIASELEPYIGVRLNHFQSPSMDGSVLELSPKIGIEAAARHQKGIEVFAQFPDKEIALLNQYQCRAIREILQRALAMFAENVKLKGDASNPAYVSFLSCYCFQEKLENNLMFDPNIPFHFLVVTSKKTLKKLQEEHGVHLTAAHDGKAIELVVLLKPCVRRVKFNFKSKEYCIVLMSEELAQTERGKGAVACMVADLDVIDEGLHTCTEEVILGTTSEMVRPPLPLPPHSEQNIRASTVLPPIIVAETAAGHIPMMQHNLPQLEQVQLPLQRSDPHGGNEQKADHGSPGSGSLHFNQCQPITSEHRPHTTTAMPAVQSRSNIQSGAILFSSIPQFSTDLIYPLPDETLLLRRGGNGQIYSGTVGSMAVVYKKTNYRSREFSIITKVKHKNLVPLLAFMYGEENPAHKRRHFCYHIMPRQTGDCARMLTDKKELTIKELHKKHSNNARKMGIIRGNLKYLLKQVLEGLRYLHSLCIAHRDVKGSNILLKFYCGCTNPLECGCDTKYQVTICDFDAAVELDKGERIPHTLVSLKTAPQSSHTQYTCVPVGTNGFRSPECSMLTISNSNEAFSPPINTRCDIWSLGILTTRMLVGATGPSTQRQMALLLLFYHRQRYMPEGLHKPGYLMVDKIVTDKLLNVRLSYIYHDCLYYLANNYWFCLYRYLS